MRVLIEINHPAQVHFFKHLVFRLRARGDRVLVMARDKDVTLRLLRATGIRHVTLSRQPAARPAMAMELLRRVRKLVAVGRRFRPDAMVARGGATVGLPGVLLRVPRIVFDDTEHARLERTLSLPLATCICTGEGYLDDHGDRQRRFRAVPVMAYLAPDVFEPDEAPLREAGIDPREPYVVLRAVSWQAIHDQGVTRPGEAVLREAIERLSRFGRVIVTSESPLPEALKSYANPVPVEHVHDLLAFASCYVGEGGSMASEAAVLGTPAVFCNPLRAGCGCILHLEQAYGLLRTVDSLPEGLAVAEQWLADPDLARTWSDRRARLVADSEDVTAFMLRVLDEVTDEGR
jgi:hypothetical protein